MLLDVELVEEGFGGGGGEDFLFFLLSALL
jgi:hypothetical protein